MVDKYTKLRIRRSWRRKQKSIEEAQFVAGRRFEKLVLLRWRNLKDVRRFVVGWLVLVGLLGFGVLYQNQGLDSYYLTDTPVPGGVYREGIVGNVTNVNPIFATSSADRAASSLIFSTLLKFDNQGNLVGDLAKKWTVDKTGEVYTVILKDNIVWHDGEQLTADDVLYTFEAIQTPDTRSYLNQSWQNIKVTTKDERTITFVLPNAFVPFPTSLTKVGIVPEHILGDVEYAEIRSHEFNNVNPIGTGPFVFDGISSGDDRQTLKLTASESYHNSPPKIEQFNLELFKDHESLTEAYMDGELVGAGGLRTIDKPNFDKLENSHWQDLPLDDGIYIFMKNSDALLKDKILRRAITRMIDQIEINKLFNSRYIPVDGPLLRNQLGYDEKRKQLSYDAKKAIKDLNSAGWKKIGPDGIRIKNKKRLEIKMVTQNNDDYPELARNLQEQMKELGVDLKVELVGQGEIQQNHIIPHNYQMLLFGISIGKDPDVFAYWHSSQSKVGGFNLSEYDNPIADIALEGGRTRSNEKLRTEKYQSFLDEWSGDAPAVGLYQPTYGYVLYNIVNGFEPSHISSPDERFNDVHKWTVSLRPAQKPY